ncbi:hypothetical protein [Xylophilus sp. GOD-11R]|uniref:hypothetical protein n=1 Tax=Xylophilus sp. GOD-11R TaxID=3089814 RepID=UPI00298C0C4E|nr:hypothetical protein [Xylophilus sp. GOD-11R]WPB57376.1 hypothetical protein R9X41_01605 [Xylophilus sp. GOD-11R]
MAQQRSIFETPDRLNMALEKIHLDDTLLKAAIDFDNLQERRDHPPAKQDNGGRRYLTQRVECCEDIRTPTRLFPFSQLLHGRTAIHVAHKHGIEDRTADIRKLRKLIHEYAELQANPALVLNISAAHQARLAIASLEAPAAKKQSKKKTVSCTTSIADKAR